MLAKWQKLFLLSTSINTSNPKKVVQHFDLWVKTQQFHHNLPTNKSDQPHWAKKVSWYWYETDKPQFDQYKPSQIPTLTHRQFNESGQYIPNFDFLLNQNSNLDRWISLDSLRPNSRMSQCPGADRMSSFPKGLCPN